MNSKLLQRISILAIAVIAALAIYLAFGTSAVHADGLTVKKYSSKVTVTTVDYEVWLKMGSRIKKSHKIRVASSNKSVAAPVVDDGRVFISVRKAGKAAVTIKNKTTGKTYKCTLKVLKYRNPFKKFYISGKNRASKFNPYNYGEFTNKKTRSKVSIKTKSGWKIKKITFTDAVYKASKEKYVFHTKKIKNNSTLKIKKTDANVDNYQCIGCVVYNKKYNFTQVFELSY